MSRLYRVLPLVLMALLAVVPAAQAQWRHGGGWGGGWGWRGGGVWLGVPPIVVAPPAYYPPPAYYYPPAYSAPAYSAPTYNSPAYYPPPAGSVGASCYAPGGYVCPLRQPAPVGGTCACTGNNGRPVQGQVGQ